MTDSSKSADSETIAELAQQRGATLQAIGIGESLQARIDAATAIAEALPPTPARAELLSALRGSK